jgi:hypothetical protein
LIGSELVKSEGLEFDEFDPGIKKRLERRDERLRVVRDRDGMEVREGLRFLKKGRDV